MEKVASPSSTSATFKGKFNSDVRTSAIDIRPDRIGADDPLKLPLERREAWAKLLSSLASGEAVESVFLEPLLSAFQFSKSAHEWLRFHAIDEARHARVLTDYVFNTFGYRKTKKSLTDRLIYDRMLPGFSQVAKGRPVFFLAGILFYDQFAIQFYTHIQTVAEKEELKNLAQFCESVQKDEKKHIAGVRALLKHWEDMKVKSARPDRWNRTTDLMLTRVFLKVLLLDVATAKWAVHNRNLKKNLSIIGIDPNDFYKKTLKALQETLSELLAEKKK